MYSKFKTVKRFHDPGDCHELTFCCYRRLPLLTNDPWRNLLAEHLDRATTTHNCRLVAYVFMPEHVHILVQPTIVSFRVDRFLHSLKTPFSRLIKSRLDASGSPLLNRLTIRERPGVYRFRFWQEGGGFDRNLRTVKSLESARDYIHANPVRRGLCQRSRDWRWSSAQHHERDAVDPPAPQPPRIDGLSTEFFLR
jgi:REP-associated tyrosine transposase